MEHISPNKSDISTDRSSEEDIPITEQEGVRDERVAARLQELRRQFNDIASGKVVYQTEVKEHKPSGIKAVRIVPSRKE